jgi:hypothetical protein
MNEQEILQVLQVRFRPRPGRTAGTWRAPVVMGRCDAVAQPAPAARRRYPVPAVIGAALAVANVYVERQQDRERGGAGNGHGFALLIDNETRRQEGGLVAQE